MIFLKASQSIRPVWLHFLSFQWTDAEGLCKDRSSLIQGVRSQEEREKGRSRRSYPGEVFYLRDKACGGEEVAEALRLDSKFPTRKGVCSCFAGHTS